MRTPLKVSELGFGPARLTNGPGRHPEGVAAADDLVPGAGGAAGRAVVILAGPELHRHVGSA